MSIYRLIFVVFNPLFNLLTQDDQVRCFENVAADGRFVVEAAFWLHPLTESAELLPRPTSAASPGRR